jgi:hypothetical protein
MDWLQFIPVFIVAALGGIVLFMLFQQRMGRHRRRHYLRLIRPETEADLAPREYRDRPRQQGERINVRRTPRHALSFRHRRHPEAVRRS